MKLIWSSNAWEDYLYWQTNDKSTLKKINALIKDIQHSPYEELDKSDPLRYVISPKEEVLCL